MKKILLLNVILCFMVIGLTGCLGFGVFDEAKDVADDSADSLDALYVDTFNMQFEVFVSDSAGGASVKLLLEKVAENNENEANAKVDLIYIPLNGGRITGFNEESLIEKSKKYKVQITKQTNTGLISEITITELVA